MPQAARAYEFFDHTADIGIRASAPTLAELFIRMAQGLTELLVEDSRVEARHSRRIELQAEDAPALLRAWLSELLYWFSTERFVPTAYQWDEVTPTQLHGVVQGDTFDPARHVQGREVKAITRHQLQAQPQDGGWRAQAIVDI